MRKMALTMITLSMFLLSSCDNGKATNEIFLDGKEVIKNVNARKALAVSFNKNFINEELFYNTATPIYSLVPENFAYGPIGTKFENIDFRDSSEDMLVYDVEKAKEYWQAAKDELGFTNTSIELLVYDTETAGNTSEFFEQEMETNLEGLDVIIRVLPYVEKQEAAESGDFHLHWTGWRPDFVDPITLLSLFQSENSFNETGWSNQEYDDLIDMATSYSSSVTHEERWQAMIDAEKILLDDAVIIPLYQSSYFYLENPEMKGWVTHQSNPGVSYQWITHPNHEIHLIETKNIATLDPNAGSDTTTNKVLGNVNEGLFKLGKNDFPVNGLISDYSYNESSKTLTFTIKENLWWTDYEGNKQSKITAYDFEYSWSRLTDPEQANNYSFMLSDLAKVKSYKAIDDYTFEVTLNERVPYLELILSYPIFAPISEDFVAHVGSEYGTSPDKTLYSGPFYVSDWRKDLQQVLIKNPFYWEADQVSLEKITVRVVPNADNNTIVNLYLNGEIDRVDLKGENIELYKNRDDVVKFDSSLVAYFTFNLK